MSVDEALAACLASVEAGEDVATAAARYPEYADELTPLLALGARLHAAPRAQLSEASFQAGRVRLAEALHAQALAQPAEAPAIAPKVVPRTMRRTASWWWPSRLVAGLALALLLSLTSFGVLQAASTSLPGSPLYPVKRTNETVQGLLATTPHARAAWHAQRSKRRCQEAWALRARGAPLDSHLLEEAKQEAQAALEVSATLSDESRRTFLIGWLEGLHQLEDEVLADEGQLDPTLGGIIEQVERNVQPAPPPPTGVPLSPTSSVTVAPSLPTSPTPLVEQRLVARVEQIEGQVWQVAGQSFQVNATTYLDGAPTVGDEVEVHARLLPGGTWQALSIRTRVKQATATGTLRSPTPRLATPTPVPSVTPSREPSATLLPTPLVSPTGNLPTPVQTSGPSSPSPSPEHSGSGSSTPNPSGTPDTSTPGNSTPISTPGNSTPSPNSPNGTPRNGTPEPSGTPNHGTPGSSSSPGPSGTPGNGDPGNGGPGNGPPGSGPGNSGPGNGPPGNGDPGNGDPGNGDPGNGDPGNGNPGNGNPGNGNPGNGTPGNSGPGNGGPGDGTPGISNPGSSDPGNGRSDNRDPKDAERSSTAPSPRNQRESAGNDADSQSL